MKNKKGFTLLELLVVVLIIGILASIALPQYRMAVTKARVASILPLMRRWYDAMAEYRLQHGDYNINDASALGVSWPTDWKISGSNNLCDDHVECSNDYWYCFANEELSGQVYCDHTTNDGAFAIVLFQPDEPLYKKCQGKIACYADGEDANKVCKALGGTIVRGTGITWEYVYLL